MSPDWPNCATPEAGDRRAVHAGQEGQRVRVAVEHGDQRARRREQALEDRVVGLGQAGARLQRAEDEVGARQAHDLGVELGGRLERLGDDGADRARWSRARPSRRR